VYPDDRADPRHFFGEADRSRRRNWKVLQLCKLVERAAAVTLAGVCESDSLLGASVVSVEPGPDSGRLMVTVVLASGRGIEDMAEARAAVVRGTAAFREEAARSVHRKRVPEVVFDVRLAEEAERG